MSVPRPHVFDRPLQALRDPNISRAVLWQELRYLDLVLHPLVTWALSDRYDPTPQRHRLADLALHTHVDCYRATSNPNTPTWPGANPNYRAQLADACEDLQAACEDLWEPPTTTVHP